jgi:hypothetical protein
MKHLDHVGHRDWQVLAATSAPKSQFEVSVEWSVYGLFRLRFASLHCESFSERLVERGYQMRRFRTCCGLRASSTPSCVAFHLESMFYPDQYHIDAERRDTVVDCPFGS